MERRAFVTTTAAVAATGALAGCMDEPSDGTGNDTDGNGTDGNQSDGDGDGVAVTDTSFTVQSRGDGDGAEDGSARYRFADGTLHVRGTIVGSDACKTAELADASYDAEADALTVAVETVDADDAGDVCAEVLTPIEYEATVSFDGAAPSVAVTHDGEDVDATEDDSVDDGDGDGVTVTSTDFTVRSRSQGEQDGSASYWFRDGALHVRGTIVGSDACKTAELADATYSADEGAVVVAVETVDAEDAGDMCAQVLTPIEYEVTVEYDGGEPDVAVTHDGESVAADEMAPQDG